MIPEKFTAHEQGPRPDDVGCSDIVRVYLSRDGYITQPMLANEVDWYFPNDPVTAYQIIEKQGD